MANTISVTGSLRISGEGATPAVSRSFNLTQVGTHFFVGAQNVGTTAETLAVTDCANLRYVYLSNPSTTGATVTVTCAAILLKPGDIFLGQPSSALMTLVSTGTSTDLMTGGCEA